MVCLSQDLINFGVYKTLYMTIEKISLLPEDGS